MHQDVYRGKQGTAESQTPPVGAVWRPLSATVAFCTGCASAWDVNKGVNKYVSNNVDTRENFSFDPVGTVLNSMLLICTVVA
jgi:hypothetical protein